MSKKRKIIFAAGVYPPQIGGPAKYAKNLNDEFVALGHEVVVVPFVFEHKLPPVIRHVWYFFRLLYASFGADTIVSFDTFTTGLPAIVVAIILRKKSVLRVGGDFLWETSRSVKLSRLPLPEFYSHKKYWGMRDRLVFWMTNFQFGRYSAVVFNTLWLRDIFIKQYKLGSNRCHVVKNFFEKSVLLEDDIVPSAKRFVWAGRPIPLKNLEILKQVFLELQKQYTDVSLEIITDLPYSELEKKIKSSYALVLPSISDVSPNFILEGIRFQKPFMVTKYTGIKDDFSGCGVFVDPLDKSSIMDGIITLLNKDKYDQYKEAMRTQDFNNSWKQIASDYLIIINSL
jgi:glycosyltransferase involved in cell wall biosynthesis